MIVNGGSRSNGAFFARHLMRADENERVDVVEIRGLAAENVRDALREMEAVASGTRCRNYFYHANLNTREDEHLTPEQWEQAADTLERELGLTGQPRFIVEHEKEGRTHQHIVWSRIDADSMTAISDSLTYRKHELAAREIEREFDLKPVASVLAKDREEQRPERRPRDWESFRGQDSGIDPHALKADITALWHAADSGLAFKAALEEQGYILAKGDRRDFCIIDPAGDEHSLARRISGVKAAGIRARMGDVDRDALPTVAEARAMARAAAEAAGGDTADPGDRASRTADTTPAMPQEPVPDEAQPGRLLHPHEELPGERPRGREEMPGDHPEAAGSAAARGDTGGAPERLSGWGRAWRAFADRASHYAARLYALWQDESGGSSPARWLHLTKDAISLAITRGEGRHAMAELADDAGATARSLLAEAPPEDSGGDRARRGGIVDPLLPDERPQPGTAAQVAPADPFDAFADEFARQIGTMPEPAPDAGHEPETGRLPDAPHPPDHFQPEMD